MSRKLSYTAIILLLFLPFNVFGACPADGFISCDPLEPVPQWNDLLIIDDTSDTSETNSVRIGNIGAALKGLATFVLTGTIDVTASTSVVGVSTLFTTELRIGDRITIQDAETRTITVITDALNLTVDIAFTDLADDSAVDALPAPLRVESSSGALLAVVNDLGDFFIKSGDLYVEDAAPDIHFRDTSTADLDINVSLVVDATDTGSGTEDADFSIHQQVAGSLERTIFSDADQGIWLYPEGNTATPFVITTADTRINSATPTLNIFDIDAAAGDINAQILFAATDTGDGTEDVDVTFSQQIAGALTDWLTADADGNITFGSGRTVAAATFSGALTGAATQITVADSASASLFCVFVDTAVGDEAPLTDASGCTYDGSTGALSVNALTVDNITLDGNDISSTSGNLTLTVPNNGKVLFLSSGSTTADVVIYQMGTGDDVNRWTLDAEGDSVQDGKVRGTFFDPSGALSLGSSASTGYAFDRLRISNTTAYKIQTETADTDAATFDLSIIAQAAGADSTSNVSGAALNFTGGDGALNFGGAANGGGVNFTTGASFGTGDPEPFVFLSDITSPTADLAFFILGTGDDASRFSVDVEGDVFFDGDMRLSGGDIIANSTQLTFSTIGDRATVGGKFNFSSTAASELTDSDGQQAFMSIRPTINQTGTAAYDGLYIDVTETQLGDGSTGDGNNLLNLALGGTSVFRVANTGAITLIISATTQDGVLITADSLTSGEGLKVISNSSDTGNRAIFQATNDHVDATGAITGWFQQDSTNDDLFLDMNGDGRAFNIDKDVTDVDSASGDTFLITNTQIVTDASTDTKSGSALKIINEVTETSGTITDTSITLDVNQTHDDATGDTVFINNDGTAAIALNIDSEATSKPVIQAVNAGALTQSVLTFGNAVDTVSDFITNASPEGAITGSIGDIARDATNGIMYFKHSGTATNTGWDALSTDEAYSSLWYHGVATTATISTQDAFTKVTVFENEGAEDALGNVVGDATTDDDITVNRAGTYEITVQASFTNSGGGSAEFHMGARIILATAKTITNATNANPIVITTSAAHGLKKGDHTVQTSVGGNTAANGDFAIIYLSDTTYSLQTLDHVDVAGNGAYTSGGTVDAVVPGDVFMERIVSNTSLGRGHASGRDRLAVGDIIEMTIVNSDGTDDLDVTQIAISVERIGN